MRDRSGLRLICVYFEEILLETNFSWLIEVNGKHIWIPKRQHGCELDAESGTAHVPEWFASEMELLI